ncbi:hypothetical protein CQW23_02377 [Capsicum baccatum]|uniref:Protein kinase domain-containing protein n=1 Tax=Capsicum baccatum TaxID=33114 RepID=A0A2G2XR92_CAPBA|nr:hypothetical protein CQW23_02377 [Capsicum baccatum]
MRASSLNIQTENGHIGMPSNICCAVVEYLLGGALKSYLIKNRRNKLEFKVVVQMVLDLDRWLCYLHIQKIVHRDVKMENMLLDKTHTVKLVDFWVAGVEDSNPNDMKGETRTFGYIPLEFLRSDFSRGSPELEARNTKMLPSFLANVMKRCWDVNPDTWDEIVRLYP